MRKTLLWSAVGLAAIVLVLIGISAVQLQLHANKEKKVANTFVQAITAGDSNTSYELFSSVAQKTQTSDDWSAQVDKLSSFFNGKTPHQDTIVSSGKDSVEVDYSISGSDGDYIWSVTLVNSKSGWLVQSFTSRLRAG